EAFAPSLGNSCQCRASSGRIMSDQNLPRRRKDEALPMQVEIVMQEDGAGRAHVGLLGPVRGVEKGWLEPSARKVLQGDVCSQFLQALQRNTSIFQLSEAAA